MASFLYFHYNCHDYSWQLLRYLLKKNVDFIVVVVLTGLWEVG